MGKIRGFIEIRRSKNDERPIVDRVHDYKEFDLSMPEPQLRDQAARCMDCGIPFCHEGCPLGNLIPEWNDLVYSGRWDDAAESLLSTNNFPEMTGRVCPAPCEASCVLNINNEPVTIKSVEHAIADFIGDSAWFAPKPSATKSGHRVAIVGSGPAGLAAAQQLARKGHAVTVFEAADRVGGLLRYGIPDFKLEKHWIDRRITQLEAEGVTFRVNAHVGKNVHVDELKANFDAIVLAGGSMKPRALDVPGANLNGVHFAMDFLTQQNRRVAGDSIAESEAILATGKHVVVLGGGDTGSDCVGTSHRQRAQSVTSFELMPRPPGDRSTANPWPEWPLVYRTSSSHEEGGLREFGVLTKRLIATPDGTRVRALEAVRVERKDGRFVEVEGSTFEIAADLVFLAMGFVHPLKEGLLEHLGVELDARGNVRVRNGATSVRGVFAAGDMARGQSLVVWAIAEGRQVAETVHHFLEASARRTA